MLTVAGRGLHVGLHAAQHGIGDFGRPAVDLARALRVADEDVWHDAGALAQRMDATAAFAAGLRLDPEVSGSRSALTLLRGGTAPSSCARGPDIPVAVALERLVTERSLRARARALLGAATPSAP